MAGVMEVMARLSGNSSGMVAAFAQGSRAAEGFSRTVESSNARVQASHAAASDAAKKAAAITAIAVGVVGVVSVDMAADFEKSTMRMKTSGGMAKDTLETVRSGILDISKATGWSAMELADGMFTVSAAGYNTAKGLDILRAAAQGAAAEGTDLSVMVDSLTSIMSVYHLKEDQVVGTTNQLVAASGLAKGTMQEFAGSLSTVLPVASAAGISFAEIGGAISVMTNKGTSAQQATQELRNAITNLQAPNQVAVNTMSQLGISSIDVSKNLGARGLSGTLDYMSQKVLGSSKDGQVLLGTMKQSAQAGQAMQSMLGGMSGDLGTWSKSLMNGTMTSKEYMKNIHSLDIEQESMGKQFLSLARRSNGFSDALRSGSPAAQTYVQVMSKMLGGQTGLQVALQLGGASMGQYKESIKAISDATKASTDEVYTNKDSQSTLAAQLARTKAEFSALMIELGNGLIPVFKDMAAGAVTVVTWFRENESVAKGLGLAFLLLGTFVATYTVTQWALNSAVLAFPGTWIALAVIALVAALVIAYDKVGWFKDFVNGAFEGIQIIADTVSRWFTDTLAPNFQKSIGLIGGFFTDSVTNVTRWKDDTLGMFSDFDKNSKGMFEDFDKNTRGMFDDMFKHIADGWSGFCKDPIGETKTFFKTMSDNFGKFSEGTSETMTTWIDGQVSNFRTWNQEASKNITDWFKSLPGDARKSNESTSKSVQANLDQQGKDFKEWNKEASKNITKWLSDAPGNFGKFSREASANLRKFNEDTLAGARGWVADNKKNFENWRSSLTGDTRKLVDTVSRNWETFERNTKGMFNDLGTHLKNWGGGVKGMFEDTVKNVGKIWDRVRNAVAAPIRFVVNTVYNEGLRPAWNNIANAVGLGGLQLPAAHFASGGIMPGYSPGVDNHVIAVGGGEAIMRPEWTKAVGADTVHAMNSMAAAGNTGGIRSMMGFANGGIVGDIMGNIGKFMSDPFGSVVSGLGGLVRGLTNQIAGNSIGKMVAEFPLKIVGGLAEKAKDAVGSMMSGFNAGGAQLGPGGWMNPASGARVSQRFHSGHNGVDLAGPMGMPIVAAQNGRVSFARYSYNGGGNEVHIDHPGGVQTWYAHLSRILVREGMNVLQGRVIGNMGSTGNSTGSHLHYMMLNRGWPNYFNPMPSIDLAKGGIVPTFDRGGILGPGLNLVNNATGAPEKLSNTTNTPFGEGTTIVLDIPELGGRLRAYVTAAISENTAEMNRSLRNSAGVPKGGF